MKKNRSYSIRARAQSFKYAFEGLAAAFRQQPNMLIHLFATIGVMILAIIFPPSRGEIIALVIVTGFVWTAEIFNTVIEKIMDFISIERQPAIKTIKDLSAAAVLVAAMTALITGGLVFIPKF